jgi:hypothetical protein
MVKKKNYPIYALEDPEGYGMSEAEVKKLWQHGVDTGIVWQLQGWYGRNAFAMIESGYLHPAKRKKNLEKKLKDLMTKGKI